MDLTRNEIEQGKQQIERSIHTSSSSKTVARCVYAAVSLLNIAAVVIAPRNTLPATALSLSPNCLYVTLKIPHRNSAVALLSIYALQHS
eukprot:7513-Heterococcus_DN1.PRE.2